MNLQNGQWKSGPNYPFSSMYDNDNKMIIYMFKLILLSIYGYATASTDTAAYILGGIDDHDKRLSTIAEYRNDKWTKYSDLRSKRYRASTLFLNGEFIIIGGGIPRDGRSWGNADEW